MNKKIFSLVCIILYTLLAVSIHCSEQKKQNSSCYQENKRKQQKNVIGSKCETQLNNNNNNYYQNDIDAYTDKRYAECIECCCGCLFIDGVCD
ncbi:fam-c protein [Plasmodium vinckei]|uniref:Fam-c protein n=1 Tax=Plasmodium vinckei TaxID=5860 RepID=A0A6V7SD52_PLAVN|nr:fam-c protein [Plasmodium vinckei]